MQEAPDVIAKQGRVAGYEFLRDQLLIHYPEYMALGLSPYNIFKLAIELDRHALFSEVQEEKKRGQVDTAKWDWYQAYLRGEIDADSFGNDEPSNSEAESPSFPDQSELIDIRSVLDDPKDDEEEA